MAAPVTRQTVPDTGFFTGRFCQMVKRIGAALLWPLALAFLFNGFNKNDPYLISLRRRKCRCGCGRYRRGHCADPARLLERCGEENLGAALVCRASIGARSTSTLRMAEARRASYGDFHGSPARPALRRRLFVLRRGGGAGGEGIDCR